MIEPNGQGGICHYTYCLANELRTQNFAITLATAEPYELACASPSFGVVTPFQLSMERRAVQWVLRRAHRRPTLAAEPVAPAQLTKRSMNASAQLETRSVGGVAGRGSRWLARREYSGAWRRAIQFAQQQRFEISHIQWVRDPVRDVQYVRSLRDRGIRVVMTAHNVLPHDASKNAQNEWATLYQAADAVIVHYSRAADQLADMGIEQPRIAVIPHGNYLPIRALTKSHADDPQAARRAARDLLDLPQDSPVVLFFGLIRPYKGLDYLLDAVAALRGVLPNVRLLLAGRAPDGLSPFMDRIRALGDAVQLIPRYLPLREASVCFEACDVVALPYTEASQSGVLHLAYAHSRPVVATTVGGVPEAVRDGVTGYLVPPRDATALFEALRSVLCDPELCMRLGGEGWRMAHEHFSWDRIAMETGRMYERVATQ